MVKSAEKWYFSMQPKNLPSVLLGYFCTKMCCLLKIAQSGHTVDGPDLQTVKLQEQLFWEGPANWFKTTNRRKRTKFPKRLFSYAVPEKTLSYQVPEKVTQTFEIIGFGAKSIPKPLANLHHIPNVVYLPTSYDVVYLPTSYDVVYLPISSDVASVTRKKSPNVCTSCPKMI